MACKNNNQPIIIKQNVLKCIVYYGIFTIVTCNNIILMLCVLLVSINYEIMVPIYLFEKNN